MTTKFEITTTNKWLYSLIVVGIFLTLGVGVLAYDPAGTGVPSLFGHSSNELEITTSSGVMTIQEAYDNGVLGGVAATPSVNAGLSGLIIKDVELSNYDNELSTCVLLGGVNDGQVKCSGHNNWGQLGVGDLRQRTSFELAVISDVDQLESMGRRFYCAVMKSGKLECWGYNGYANLGDGTTTNKESPVNVERNAAGSHLENVVKVGVCNCNSHEYACAITSEASENLYCWGYGGRGQLGLGDSNSALWAKPLSFFANHKVLDVKMGGSGGGVGHRSRTCAIVDDLATGAVDRHIYCWGNNWYGSLGIGDQYPRGDSTISTPVRVPGLVDVQEVIVNADSSGTTCAITGSERKLYCWGRNDRGQVGDGTTANRHLPNSGNGLTGVDDLVFAGTSGYASYCALIGGEVWCWGYNSRGQVGNGLTTNQLTPDKIDSLTGVTKIEGYGYGSRGHYCVIKGANDEVWCWGANNHDQLGQGSSGNSQYNTPVHVSVVGSNAGLSNVKDIDCGGYNEEAFCSVIMNDNTVMFWGRNDRGNLGMGDTQDRSVATPPL